jgi:GAF domain-containing protein
MQIPARPRDEALRIETLLDLVILDSEPEERFDLLTGYASSQFDVPIALVSLVDMNRQWFKSRCGLGATETGRDISFCGHAILQDDIFEIRDAQNDERFADNPLVTGDPRIRFYAGCPLKMPNGQNIGTFCLIDRKPKALDEWEKQHLRDLARVVVLEIQGMDTEVERRKFNPPLAIASMT